MFGGSISGNRGSTIPRRASASAEARSRILSAGFRTLFNKIRCAARNRPARKAAMESEVSRKERSSPGSRWMSDAVSRIGTRPASATSSAARRLSTPVERLLSEDRSRPY
ncbi:MAG: hypothetical protein DMF52_07255 [Acidobacteria bacterium]|nr:MAG: hypothetical protein DMF52_07255 [Acidobacteriota bacterium]